MTLLSSTARYCTQLFAAFAPRNNGPVGPLVVPRLVTSRRLAPRRNRVAAAGGLAFTAAMRMIHRVHGHAANRGTLAQPARAAGLADPYIFMIRIAYLPDGGHARRGRAPHFAGRQLDLGDAAFLGYQ